MNFWVPVTKSLWLAFGIHWGANIAFESSHSIIHTRNLVKHNGTTWLLAITWGLLFMQLMIYNLNTSSKEVV